MALESATNFKAALALAAVQLTTAWTDTVQTKTALEISDPRHPLRQLEKLFNYNAQTGVITSDDAYVDACYAGGAPSKGSTFDVQADWLAFALSTATVENAAAANVVLTFDRDVANASNISVGNKAISSVVIAGAVVTITVAVAFVNADVISCNGDFRTADGATLKLVGESVTNNVT
jgi:hypothetical protein